MVLSLQTSASQLYNVIRKRPYLFLGAVGMVGGITAIALIHFRRKRDNDMDVSPTNMFDYSCKNLSDNPNIRTDHTHTYPDSRSCFEEGAGHPALLSDFNPQHSFLIPMRQELSDVSDGEDDMDVNPQHSFLTPMRQELSDVSDGEDDTDVNPTIMFDYSCKCLSDNPNIPPILATIRSSAERDYIIQQSVILASHTGTGMVKIEKLIQIVQTLANIQPRNRVGAISDTLTNLPLRNSAGIIISMLKDWEGRNKDDAEKSHSALRDQKPSNPIDIALPDCLDTLASRQLLEIVGDSKTPAKKNRTDTDLITRTVMRHPHPKAMEALYTLHKMLRLKFQNHSEEALQWLLGGSSQYARGGFKNVDSFKAFLNAEAKDLEKSPSRLITGLSTILSAIAYRAASSPNGAAPVRPQTRDQINMSHAIDTSSNVVTHHTHTYPDSRSCFEAGAGLPAPLSDFNPHHSFLTPMRQELSDVSDGEDEMPLTRLPVYQLKKMRADNKKTWVGAAEEGNIPVRSSISGSVLLSLAALLTIQDSWNEDELALLTGTLMIPTYHRADYHSIAETAAAFQHYLDRRKNRNKQVLTPYQALQLGLGLMTKCVDPRYIESVTKLSRAILSSTRDVGYES